ncbi:hypothetical protein ElyMa_002757600 [Elysia marginata]|uniref:Uncharacterized protein n=1 Tax=Elysia marginata TaxID=1093978 RepID=A0AAV4HIH5_9GAST|nr:hypothetical protein ElyMa_002757600 [Elysia marginata]
MSTDKDTEVITHIDIGSGHRIEINKRLARLKRIKRKKAIKINVKQLKGADIEFKLSLQNRFEKLKDEPLEIDNLNMVITESTNEVTKTTGTEEKSEEDKERDQLEKKNRKELRRKENKTTRDKIEYIQTNKKVKKLRRKRALQKRKEFVTNILEQKKSQQRNIQTWQQKENILYEKRGWKEHDRQRRNPADMQTVLSEFIR